MKGFQDDDVVLDFTRRPISLKSRVLEIDSYPIFTGMEYLRNPPFLSFWVELLDLLLVEHLRMANSGRNM
jgi:hypothetical protein